LRRCFLVVAGVFFGAGRPAARRLGVRRLSALADGFALEIGIMLCLAAAGLLFFHENISLFLIHRLPNQFSDICYLEKSTDITQRVR